MANKIKGKGTSASIQHIIPEAIPWLTDTLLNFLTVQSQTIDSGVFGQEINHQEVYDWVHTNMDARPALSYYSQGDRRGASIAFRRAKGRIISNGLLPRFYLATAEVQITPHAHATVINTTNTSQNNNSNNAEQISAPTPVGKGVRIGGRMH